jgi:hypothetical protein
MKKTHIVIVVIVLIVGVAIIYWFNGRSSGKQNNNTNVNSNANLNVNTNTVNANDNSNDTANENANDSDILTNQEVTVEGTVFVKGYKTPSESYGVLTSDNQEVGLGSYDSAREQFRVFVGDRVSVTFEKVCRSNHENCCRSLFFYCGTIKNYKSIK